MINKKIFHLFSISLIFTITHIMPMKKIDPMDIDTEEDSSQKLHQAIKERKLDYAIQLIEKGANVNIKDESGMTPLHHAIHATVDKFDHNKEKYRKKTRELIKIIINNIKNKKNYKKDFKDKFCCLPIWHAIQLKSLDAIILLLTDLRLPNLDIETKKGKLIFDLIIEKFKETEIRTGIIPILPLVIGRKFEYFLKRGIRNINIKDDDYKEKMLPYKTPLLKKIEKNYTKPIKKSLNEDKLELKKELYGHIIKISEIFTILSSYFYSEDLAGKIIEYYNTTAAAIVKNKNNKKRKRNNDDESKTKQENPNKKRKKVI